MKKKTNINRPKISSSEINQGKNFDQLYKQYAKVSKPFYKKNWFIANTLVVIGAVALIFILNTPNNDNNTTDTSGEEHATETMQYADNGASSAFIDPILDGLDVPFNTYTVDAKKGKKIEHTTGSIIKIPANAFVDANGKRIKGKVEIKYREFKDVAEIIASGIPMTYKMGDEEMHFESAGMIEIMAYQDGEQVFMNPNKKVDIEMTSDYPGNHYNLYNLDTVGKEWVDIGKDKVVYKNGEEETAKNGEANRSRIVEEGELLVELNEPEQSVDSKLVVIKEELVEIQNDIKKLNQSAPNEPQEATNERFRFDIDYKKEEFPELETYKGMEFEVGEENKNFSPNWFENEWQDMQLTKKNKDSYYLELTRYANAKKGSDKSFDKIVKKLTVYPVFVGENYAVAKAAFDKKYKSYSKKLTTRKADEKRKQEEYEKELARIEAKQEQWRKSQKKMNQKVDKWIDNAEASDDAYVTSSQMYRLFSIEKFGIYNCDNPVSLPKGQTLVAKLYNGGEEIKFNKLFLVEKGRNAVFAYYPNRIRNFKFNPRKDNMLVGVTEDNKLIIYSVEQFKSIPTKARSHNFDMEVKETNPENLKELRKCISYI